MTQEFVIDLEILSTVNYIRKYVTRIQLRRFISGNVLLWPSVRTRLKANGNLYLMVCFAETMDLARSSKCIRRDFCSEVGPQRVLHSFWLYFWQAAADNGRNWFQPCRLSTLHSSHSSETWNCINFRITLIQITCRSHFWTVLSGTCWYITLCFTTDYGHPMKA